MSTHPPLSTLADAAVASNGTCHCYPEWHNFLVYIFPHIDYIDYIEYSNNDYIVYSKISPQLQVPFRCAALRGGGTPIFKGMLCKALNPCSPEGFSQTYFPKGGCCNPPWIINTEGHITLNLLPVYRYGHPLSIDTKISTNH